MLNLQPITFKEACAFITSHHSHHLPPQGWKFGIAVNDGIQVVGVITLGRPISRHFDDGLTLEITRCCTCGYKNSASKLLGAARKAAFALGYKRIISYTLSSESGVSLKASGYRVVGSAGGGSWSCHSRPRIDTHPLQLKVLWQSP